MLREPHWYRLTLAIEGAKMWIRGKQPGISYAWREDPTGQLRGTFSQLLVNKYFADAEVSTQSFV